MFLSVTHFHGDHDDHTNELDHQIEQQIVECTICASHFKFSSDSGIAFSSFLIPEVKIEIVSEIHISDEINTLLNGRSPPFIG